MQKDRFKKHNKKNQNQKNEFTVDKIGSGYMATIEGQPHLQDFVKETKKRKIFE